MNPAEPDVTPDRQPRAPQTDKQDPRHRRRVRRCFMHGKACIFCATQAGVDDDPRAAAAAKETEVFVVMPFRPNLDTFYEWSLKSYLKEGLGIRDEKHIRRADEFRNIGYIMCEKICRRIQEADMVVVDLSLDNPNVFYELGLAIGLGKRLLFICDEQACKGRGNNANAFWHSLGLGLSDALKIEKVVIKYPNVGFLDAKKFPPADRAVCIPLKSLAPKINIVPLLVRGESQTPPENDIKVDFAQALRAALGVAIHNMRTAEAPTPQESPLGRVRHSPWGDAALKTLDDNLRDFWSEVDKVPWLADESGRPPSFASIATEVDQAFICIVDLAGENPLSYFWLGYCHARGINVIPIFRSLMNKRDSHPAAGATGASRADADEGRSSPHVLAFDLRALWYIDFRDKEVKHLASLLEGVLEELVARDVPRRERNIFWERLTRDSSVHIFTGAVHHPSPSREVVGDWDLRTVSELVRFLSSTDQSVIPRLATPMYIPETIRWKIGGQATEGDWLQEYIQHIHDKLKDRNCLLIASADVNPMTEVALGRLYQVDDRCFHPAEDGQIRDSLTIALKGPTHQPKEPQTKSEGDHQIRPYFSRSDKKLKPNYRGFRWTGTTLQERYYSQDEAGGNPFAVLAHLVVMRNLFSGNPRNTIIVILNGVSGPGTYGLAEVLTGGEDDKKAPEAEELLDKINRCCNKLDTDDDVIGMEAIIRVSISPEQKTDKKRFYDLRVVNSWEWAKGADGTDKIDCSPKPIRR